MTQTNLYLFEDRRARRWAPFSLTRPAGELLFGCLTLRERAEHIFGMKCQGHLSRHALVGFDEPDSAPTISLDEISEGTRQIIISSRAAPDFQDIELPDEPAWITVNGIPAGWVLPPGTEPPSELALRDPSINPGYSKVLELQGEIIEYPWTLLAQNPARIQTDIETLWPQHSVPDGSVLIGDGPVSLGSGAKVEPGVVFDTRHGPIRLAENTRVEGPARLTGPLFIGPESVIYGGRVGTSSIGPVCHLHGEVSDSVFIGFSNKSHSGYIGHSLVGRWVNLGAYTTNSDLKNNYGPVRVWTPEGYIDTGQIKVGCFLGDHVKTGIGMTLNTGTVVGAGSNLFGNVMPSSKVPAFSWGSGDHLARHRLPEFLATAKQVMARRKIELTPGVVRVLEKAWKRTAERLTE